MGTLNGTDNALFPCQVFKCLHSFIVGDGYILCTSYVMQIGMFGADARVIQTCGNGDTGVICPLSFWQK